MQVFVTGATGWVGSVVVRELVEAGHTVRGLCRSQEKAATLTAAGAKVVQGTLDDLDVLRGAAAEADAVAHLAFNHDWIASAGHDFSQFAASGEQDRRAIETLGAALQGSDRPLLVTSGVAGLAAGRLALETDSPSTALPRQSEAAAAALAAGGARVATVRLPPTVHGVGDHGFLPILIKLAREKGVSAYIGNGENRWAATHQSDAGRLYRLALEHGITEPAYHAIAEEGVPFREIAAAIGCHLNVPVEPRPAEHFGWFGAFAGMDMAASSAQTRGLLGWQPTGPTLLADLDQPEYYN